MSDATKPKRRTTKPAATATNDAEAIAAYSKGRPPAIGAICDRLRELIDATIPKATAKIWHGGPVWFVGENPVVGYDAKPKGVQLVFWNGQSFDEEGLEPLGKYRAAEASFTDPAGIDAKRVRRWLKKAGTDVFDSKAFFAKMRARRAR